MPRNTPNPHRNRLLPLSFVVAAGLLAVSLAAAQPPETPADDELPESTEIQFLQVYLDDETAHADEALHDYLEEATGLTLSSRTMSYDAMIDRLVSSATGGGPLLARVTPYVWAVAQMLGAPLEVTAIYLSHSTGSTTYRSYFVVNADDFAGFSADLDGLVAWLESRRGASRARFVFHNPFSTSSFFMPSRFFRENKIFATEKPSSGAIAIESEERKGGSTDLVRHVAANPGHFAAVWDGTKAKFETGGGHAQLGEKVVFIALPSKIPNDLLVHNTGMGERTQKDLRQAVRAMKPETLADFAAGKPLGDFALWIDPEESHAEDAVKRHRASEARAALASLRLASRERTAPVLVEVDGEDPALVEAARAAIDLSGTELVRRDKELHERRDVRWEIEHVHEGAAKLTTEITDLEGEDVDGQKLTQEFRISYRDAQDLSRRIVLLIHERMHRIRYLWPYPAKRPTVVRDVPFALAPGSPLLVQQIRWINPDRNIIEVQSSERARLRAVDFFKFELEETAAGFGADPLADLSHRVILVRPSQQSPLLAGFGAVYVLLFVSAAVLAVRESRKRRDYAADDRPNIDRRAA